MNDRKVVIITGASRGIGYAAARLFLDNGYVVYAFSRSGCNLKGVNSVVCDITQGAKLKESIDDVFNKEKRIDVLVNNAGGGISGAVEKTGPAEARDLFELNFFAVFEAVKYTVPYMRAAGGGVIINVGSVAGELHVPFQAFYSASKAAVEALSNCLRGELEPFNIRVATILPGDTQTGFTDARQKNFEAGDADYGSRIERSIGIMERDERGGMSPQKTAKVIYKASLRKSPRPLYAVGFKYGFFLLLGRIFPKSFVLWILNSMYAK